VNPRARADAGRKLLIALALSAAIGSNAKSGRRAPACVTHTLVGLASALIMLVSKYGFTDVLADHVVIDPSRVAAQIRVRHRLHRPAG